LQTGLYESVRWTTIAYESYVECVRLRAASHGQMLSADTVSRKMTTDIVVWRGP